MAISIHFLLKQAWLILRHNIRLQTNQHCPNINFFSFLLTWPRLATSRAIFVLARNHARRFLDFVFNIWFWPLKSFYHDLQKEGLSSLTLQTLRSTFEFSFVTPIHFLQKQWGEVDKKSSKFILCDHVHNSHDHSVLQSIDIARRNLMLITLRA